eukprot:356484-Chlamydomonas_euryale.AAC.2
MEHRRANFGVDDPLTRRKCTVECDPMPPLAHPPTQRGVRSPTQMQCSICVHPHKGGCVHPHKCNAAFAFTHTNAAFAFAHTNAMQPHRTRPHQGAPA